MEVLEIKVQKNLQPLIHSPTWKLWTVEGKAKPDLKIDCYSNCVFTHCEVLCILSKKAK